MPKKSRKSAKHVRKSKHQWALTPELRLKVLAGTFTALSAFMLASSGARIVQASLF